MGTSVKKKRELFLGFAPTCQGSFVLPQKIDPWELVQEFQPDSLSIGREKIIWKQNKQKRKEEKKSQINFPFSYSLEREKVLGAEKI